jgi:putative membrane protein
MTNRRDEDEEVEPDYRFTLANERTFLAWTRTSFGLIAGGVAVHQLLPRFATANACTTLAALCIGLAAVLAASAYIHWWRVQKAMRRGEPLPRNPMLLVVSVTVLAITGYAAVLVMSG